jgi:hypothetical protein
MRSSSARSVGRGGVPPTAPQRQSERLRSALITGPDKQVGFARSERGWFTSALIARFNARLSSDGLSNYRCATAIGKLTAALAAPTCTTRVKRSRAPRVAAFQRREAL